MKKAIKKRKLSYTKSAIGRVKNMEAEMYNPDTKVKTKHKVMRHGLTTVTITEKHNLAKKKKIIRKVTKGIGKPAKVEITTYGRKKKGKKTKYRARKTKYMKRRK